MAQRARRETMIWGLVVGFLVIGAFLIGLGSVITKVLNAIDEEDKDENN